MKRILALLLAALLLVPFSALAETAPEMSDVENMTAPGVLPIVTAPAKLTLSVQYSNNMTSFDENLLTELVERETGIDVEFVYFSASDEEALQKFAVMCTSGQTLPDIMGLKFTAMDRLSYGQSGFFIPLDDYFGKYSSFVDQAYAKWCDESEIETVFSYGRSPDGHLYAFPAYSADPSNENFYGLVINKKFLEAVDKQMPATTDELYDVLVAFRDGDPNGNGENDELPLVGTVDWLSGKTYPLLINAFIYYNFETRLNVENGTLYAPYVRDEFREALRYLRKLYSENLITESIFTMTGGQYDAIMAIDPPVVGVSANSALSLNRLSGDYAYDYVSLPPLAGPEGKAYAITNIEYPSYRAAITRDCATPEIAFRFIDFFSREDVALSLRYGVNGWRYLEEGEADSVKWQYPDVRPVYKVLDSTMPEFVPSDLPSTWINNSWALLTLPPKLSSAVPVKLSEDERLNYIDEVFYEGVAQRRKFIPDEFVSGLVYTAEELAGISEIQASMYTYVDESIMGFITGELSLDDDWTSYVATCVGIGMDELVSAGQVAYDRMKAN